jgi:hypothetical protein
LQEYVNEIPINPLWQWCPTVTPQATSCDWQVGNDTNTTRHNVALTAGKTSIVRPGSSRGDFWCRVAGPCVGQLMQDLSTGREVILEHSF